jgi:hypothetical protein
MINLVIGILQIILAIGFILFWTYFFLVENKKQKSEIYFAFERSFPIPDLGLITPLLIISAIGNLLGERYGIFFSIVSGGSLLFLGLIDVSFNVQQKKLKSKTDLITSFAINIICLVFGTISVVYGWLYF